MTMVDVRLSRTALRKNVTNPICKFNINLSTSIIETEKISDANYRRFRIRNLGGGEFGLAHSFVYDVFYSFKILTLLSIKH